MLQAILSPQIILALLGYIISISLLLWVSVIALQRIHALPAEDWLSSTYLNNYMKFIWLPLIRIIALLIFLCIAYPRLYGNLPLPALNNFISGWHQLSTLINLMFITGLLLPLIPIIGSLHAVTMPVQASAAIALLFSWVAHSLALQHISLYPGLSTLLIMFLLAIAGHSLASWTSQKTGNLIDREFHYEGFARLLYPCFLFIFQTPAFILYSTKLGEQLAG